MSSTRKSPGERPCGKRSRRGGCLSGTGSSSRGGRCPRVQRPRGCSPPPGSGSLPAPWIGFLLPLAQAWTFEMAFHFFLALLSAYFFLRDLRCGEVASFFGSV